MFNTSHIQTVTACANVDVSFLSISGTCRELQPVARNAAFGRFDRWRRFLRVDGISLHDAQCRGKALVGETIPFQVVVLMGI